MAGNLYTMATSDNGIKYIVTSGSDLEIGRQSAELLGEAVKKGMVSFYSRLWHRAFQANPISEKVFKPILTKGIEKPLQKQIPQWLLQRMLGIHEVSGIPYPELLTSCVLPDLMPYLQALFAKLFPDKVCPVRLPHFGCSSFVAYGKKGLIQGRNLDFPGVNYWDRFPVIQLFEPTDGFRYVGFTTAGIPVGGITGINEHGISVALHQHYTCRVALAGVLPFVVGEAILKQARTLAEARRVIEKFQFSGGWGVVVVDGRANNAFVCEANASLKSYRYLDRPLTHTNYYQNSESQRGEYATTARMTWDNYYRNDRLQQCLRQNEVDLAGGCQLISDHWDGFLDREKVVNRCVSQLYNIQSLVIDHSRQEIAIAAGQSPLHLRKYYMVSLQSLFNRKPIWSGTQEGYRFQDKRIAMAKEQYTNAFVSFFDEHWEESREQTIQSIETYFTPETSLVSGLLNLRQKDFKAALASLQSARDYYLDLKTFPPEYFETLIWLARTHSLSSQERAALLCYREVEHSKDNQDRNLKKIASRALPYRERDLKKLLVPFSSYIPFL